MNRLSRKELKTDHFVEEVTHGVDYVSHHKSQIVKIAIAGAVALALIAGGFFYFQTQRSARQDLLAKAYSVKDATFGPAQNGAPPSTYPSQAARDQAANKAFAEVAAKDPSSEEGATAKYFMGAYAANEAKWAEAEKLFKEAADSGKGEVVSLAQYSLAQVYIAQNKNADAEKLLKTLVDSPGLLVSKEQAQLTLGRLQLRTSPAEGKKLLESLRTASSAVSRAAVAALGESN